MAIRVLHAYGADRHQDLLLVTSVDLPLLHHVFPPAGDVQDRVYSSSLPFRAGDERFLLGALPRSESPRPHGGDELDRRDRAAATGELRFDLAVARLEGRFRPVAELHIGERLSSDLDALRFNPFNCGGGLRPSGLFNRWRAGAYPLSRAALRHTARDGAERHDAADRRLRALDPPRPRSALRETPGPARERARQRFSPHSCPTAGDALTPGICRRSLPPAERGMRLVEQTTRTTAGGEQAGRRLYESLGLRRRDTGSLRLHLDG